MAVQDECESKDTSTTNDDSADCCSDSMSASSLFDMTVVRDRFHEAYSSGDAAGVRLRHYIDGYTELQKFMDLLGPLFSFVSKDVSDKLGLLERLHSGPNRVHYETVESMISYEVQNDVRKWKRESGTRTLLRLHRPLLFINNFMQGVPRQEEHQGLSSLACEVYRSTLAQHHPFLIRQAVSVAMWTLPTKHNLVRMVCKHSYEEVLGHLSELHERIMPVYQRTDELFTQNNLHDLA